MNIDWNHQKCIVCHSDEPLTLEHVIPKSIGGKLTSRFICKRCNSQFGSSFEAKARLAPEIRKAASGLDSHLLELKESLEKGAQYKSAFGDHIAKSKLRSDGRLGTAQLNDGSLIVPEVDAPEKLASMLRGTGATEEEVQGALECWAQATPGQHLGLGGGISIRKWHEHPSTPIYSEAPLSSLLLLKIAFQFSALIIGGSIYDCAFQCLRKALIDGDEAASDRWVTNRWADKPDSFHGIAFLGKDKSAQFQVRLFGLLAYTVRFPNISFNHEALVYTHRIDTAEEWANIIEGEDP
ncbi:MAG: HNH endonuclease [Pseudomonadota bacterium]